MFSCFDGKLIDVSDYHPEHYDEFGDRSLADGYGPVYLNPRRPDFETAFKALIDSDEPFENPKAHERRDSLLTRNPTDLSGLLDWMETYETNIPQQESEPVPQ